MAKLILPLLNKRVTLFRGPSLYLSETMSLEKLLDNDAGLIWSMQNQKDVNIPQFNKCIYIQQQDPFNCEKAKEFAIVLRFLFNCFRHYDPIYMPLALIENKPNKLTIHWLELYESTHKTRNSIFKIKQKTKRDIFVQYCKFLQKAITIDSGLYLTLDRFNTALIRHNLYDRVVDLTVSAESLIAVDTEINFRFAIYNAFISGSTNIASRSESFKQFSSLYNARSKFVHGAALNPNKRQKMIEKIEQYWPDLIHKIRNSIIYYVMFLNEKEKDQWPSHLRNLTLGVEQPLY